MVPLDEKTLSELKLAQARAFQQWFASDNVWNLFQEMREVYEGLLSLGKKLQPLARRHKNNPVRFCEKTLGPRWFETPDRASARQVQELLKIFSVIQQFPTAPEELARLNGKQLLKHLQTLAAGAPGRKPAEIHARALLLRRAHPKMGMHQICLQLNPAYAAMSAADKRDERERIRSGLRRRKKKAAIRAQAPRNTPR
jgi:hypothetical protein